jgi:hypothetical protein
MYQSYANNLKKCVLLLLCFNINYEEESTKNFLRLKDFEVPPCFSIYSAGKYNYFDSWDMTVEGILLTK